MTKPPTPGPQPGPQPGPGPTKAPKAKAETPEPPAPKPATPGPQAPASQVSSVVSACDLLMGDSGSGKTSLLATLAEWVWQKYRLVTLLYSADPGGWTTEVQVLINRGIIRVWKVPSRDPEDRLGLAFETCSRASQGYWPKSFIDLEKGRVPIGVELVPPVSHEFILKCPKGHVVRRVSSEAQLVGQFICAPDKDPAKCGLPVSMRNGKVTRKTKRTKGFENVGAVCYDGLTSLCAWAMRDLQNRGALVEAGDRDALRSSMKIESGDMAFGSSTPTHYGAAQSLAERMLNAAGAIPYLVTRPVWTALEKRGTDEKTQTVIYGPELPGSAKTATAPQWVGNLLGVCALPGESGKSEWRIYLRRYYTPNDPVPHLAKTRVAPGYLPEFLSDGAVDDMGNPVSGSKPFTQFNLGTFYEMEARALEQQQKDKDALYPDSPGLVAMEIGEERLDEGTGLMTGVSVAPGGPGPRPAPGPGPPPPSPTAAPKVQAPAPAAAPAPVKGPKPAPGPAPPVQAAPEPAGPAEPAATPQPVPPAGPRPPAAATTRPK